MFDLNHPPVLLRQHHTAPQHSASAQILFGNLSVTTYASSIKQSASFNTITKTTLWNEAAVELTCLWVCHRAPGTSALNRCRGTPVWAGGHREVCFCLTLVSSPLRFPGRGTGTGPAVWPSSPAAHPQKHLAPDQAPSRRTTLQIW